jgi:DNA-binding NtrC family response regulator
MVRCVLIIDADQDERRWLEQAVSGFGYPVCAASGVGEALEAIAAPNAPRIALALLRLDPEPDAAERSAAALMERLGRLPDRPSLIALAASGPSPAVIRVLRAGAVDFVARPISAERLEVSITNALKISALERELDRSRRRASGLLTFDDITAVSEEMKRVTAQGRRAAGLAVPILLEGEPGVGKELLARAIHAASSRAARPFVTVNCAAIPPQLMEEVLFGPDKAPSPGRFGAGGRHPGACQDKVGRSKFDQAMGGSLFLEEPGELPAHAQERLWRILQEESAGLLGGARPREMERAEHGPKAIEEVGRPRSDVHIIAAASQDLIALAKTGAFREDLYMRLNAFTIYVPPLRERGDDIPELVETLIARFAAEEGKRIDGAEPRALDLIRRYPWPGNIRQLENAVYRAVVLAEGPMLTVNEFPQIAAQVEGFPVRTPPAPSLLPKPPFSGPAMIGADFPLTQTIDLSSGDGPPGAGGQGGGHVLGIPALNEQGDVRPLDAVEADMIRLAVGHYRGHMTEVARRLGIGRSTLYRKLREIGVDAGAH